MGESSNKPSEPSKSGMVESSSKPSEPESGSNPDGSGKNSEPDTVSPSKSESRPSHTASVSKPSEPSHFEESSPSGAVSKPEQPSVESNPERVSQPEQVSTSGSVSAPSHAGQPSESGEPEQPSRTDHVSRPSEWNPQPSDVAKPSMGSQPSVDHKPSDTVQPTSPEEPSRVEPKKVQSIALKTSVTLKKKQKYNVTVRIKPSDAANPSISVKSLDTSIVKVVKKSNTVLQLQAKKAGITRITVATKDGSKITKKLLVKVRPDTVEKCMKSLDHLRKSDNNKEKQSYHHKSKEQNVISFPGIFLYKEWKGYGIWQYIQGDKSKYEKVKDDRSLSRRKKIRLEVLRPAGFYAIFVSVYSSR